MFIEDTISSIKNQWDLFNYCNIVKSIRDSTTYEEYLSTFSILDINYTTIESIGFKMISDKLYVKNNTKNSLYVLYKLNETCLIMVYPEYKPDDGFGYILQHRVYFLEKAVEATKFKYVKYNYERRYKHIYDMFKHINQISNVY